MNSSASVPSGMLAVRPGSANSKLATQPFQCRLPGRRIKSTCLKFPIVAALALWIISVALPRPATAAYGTWSYTGSMVVPDRMDFTATLLPDGKVLVAGGAGGNSAEIYDRATGTWKATNWPMNVERRNPTATLLPNGRVLIVGGWNVKDGFLSSAEVYDPPTESFLFAYPLAVERAGHTATLLPNGKVLVVGGQNGSNIMTGPVYSLASAELFDPATDTWTSTATLNTSRAGHTATLLPNGQVLVAGGLNVYGDPASAAFLKSAELYFPGLDFQIWSPTDSMSVPRARHTATLMRNGKVLMVGGYNGTTTNTVVELYDLSWEIFGTTASLNSPSLDTSATATLLANGQVLLTERQNAHLYDPVSQTWSPTGATTLQGNTATLLANGKVLAAGGYSYGQSNAELYNPAPPPKVNLPDLLAFYPFNGDALDYSGKHRDCTYPIYYQPQLVPGYQGQAYSFNNAYLSASVNIDPANYPRLTMGAWAKPTAIGTIAPLLTQDNGGYDRQVGLDTRGGGTGWSAFCGPDPQGLVLGAVPAIQGKWTFVAVVYDQPAGTVRLQVDDMVLTRSEVTLKPGIDYLAIGGSPPMYFDQYFTGVIDNVFVFGDALTDQQLAYIRSRGAQAFSNLYPGLLLLLLTD